MLFTEEALKRKPAGKHYSFKSFIEPALNTGPGVKTRKGAFKMADVASGVSEKSFLMSYAPNHREHMLATCGYSLIVASLVSFTGVAAMKVSGGVHPVNPSGYQTWVDLFAGESVAVTLFVVGTLTAILAIQLLTTVRLAGTRTLPDGGNEQPQFFALVFKEAGQGRGYSRTIREGSEADLRAFMADGGIPEAAINEYFHHAQ